MSPARRWPRPLAVPLYAALAALLPAPAAAVPTYARRYRTSCQTCHTVFPRLTPFGDAFRRSGHAYPEGDEDVVKEEPVSLGSDAYKDLFPSAVWPSELPFTPPVSVVARGRVTAYDAATGAAADLSGLNAVLDVYLAAPMGGGISVFGKFQVNGPACTNCHTHLAVAATGLVPGATIKVGRFQPEYFGFHQQPYTELHDLLGPSRGVGNNAWNFGKDVGAEIAGIVAGRARYVAGIAEGQDALNLGSPSKTAYARAGYKLGGMRLDGLEEPGYEQPPENWRERSLTAGLLVLYSGSRLQTNDAEGAPVVVDDDTWAASVDASAVFDDLTVYGGAIVERHSRPTGTDRDVWAERYFAGLRYTVFPWLVPALIFDYSNSQLRGDQSFQIRPRLEVLARANIKLRVDATIARPAGGSIGLGRVEALVDAGF